MPVRRRRCTVRLDATRATKHYLPEPESLAMNTSFLRAATALAIVSTQAVTSASAATACTVTSGATVPVVVELYTSEGCDSCPPADRWLSKTITERSKDAAFIPLAYHVDYWDYIGWKDPFAQPAFTQRQSALAASGRATGVYTPQIFVNGKDDRSWTGGAARLAAAGRASVKFSVAANWKSEGTALTLGVSGKLAELIPGVRLRYAVTENGLISAVKAGENRGVTLHHDAVVRATGALPMDASGAFSLNVPVPRTVRQASSQLHVIAEDTRGNPLAAATISCAS